ncbi:FdtA/QdtA family cupin domain-containing protein [Candidatus Gracilibacteria bacterium]|nr:FdtA/QdtA family cupin domain-containing protein [Candidatus Gracilibacteria bacterium]
MRVKKFKILEFPYFSDDRGETIPFELDESFPFVVKRVYIVTGRDGEVRGGHAHKHEQELFVCVSGRVKVLIHDGQHESEISLENKNKALLVRSHCWHEFWDFSPDAVLLAFSSTHYEGRNGYIESKTEFLKS